MKKLFLSLLLLAGTSMAFAQAEKIDERQEVDQDKIQQEPQRATQVEQERAARVEAQRVEDERVAKLAAKLAARKVAREKAKKPVLTTREPLK